MIGSTHPAWLTTIAGWLTPRRLRAHAIILALCLWGACAVDFSTPGFFDRAGNIKFQDFLPFYVSARLIAQGRAADLYNQQLTADEMQKIIRQPLRARLPNLYGPQVGLFFESLTRFSFPTAAWLWIAFSVPLFFACVLLVWNACPALRPYPALVVVSALAFPPMFHFFVRGQISALPLACFTAAFLAFRAQRPLLAGLALGLLAFKPQFLIAIPLVLLFSFAWKTLAGLTLSAAAQLIFTHFYFGSSVMHSYFDTLFHPSRWITTAELGLAQIQMHSLRAFWSLLIPWPEISFVLYFLTSCIAIAAAAAIWKSPRPLALRFSALTLAAVVVNPHLFVYDLLVLTPLLLLLADWTLTHESTAIRVLLYLAFVTPLLGPLSQWTHLQLSVPVFTALLWQIRKLSPNH